MQVGEILGAVRARRPLVHCLTNDVTVGRVADALAALGALPVMASAEEEAAEMVEQAQALLLNLGTPRPERWRACASAGARATSLHLPVVLDPVGCGATAWRTTQARALVRRVRPDVVRGNVPEMAALAGLEAPRARLRGVAVEDADGSCGEAEQVARLASGRLGCVVLATGRTDVLAHGSRAERWPADVALLRGVVGAGDVLAAAIAACRAVEPESWSAARAGRIIFTAAARLAAARADGPGTFWPAWLDAASSLQPASIAGIPATSGVCG